ISHPRASERGGATVRQTTQRSIWIIAGVPSAALVLLLGGCSTTAVFHAALAFMLCAAAGHDLVLRRIENGTVLAVVLLRVWELVLAGIADPPSLAAQCAFSIAGGAVVLAVLLGTARIMERGTGSAGIGGGDVKLLAALGLCLGWEAGLATVGLSCLLMVLHRFAPRTRRADAYAFAPYIAVASMFTMLFL
ncbi:MAG: prepilin peptidase, partial [Coriobacteriaceae bacterium]|nr:prepilin peptidase [Coriobacteriaceae bacterium]